MSYKTFAFSYFNIFPLLVTKAICRAQPASNMTPVKPRTYHKYMLRLLGRRLDSAAV